jgi:hypothetical protein
MRKSKKAPKPSLYTSVTIARAPPVDLATNEAPIIGITAMTIKMAHHIGNVEDASSVRGKTAAHGSTPKRNKTTQRLSSSLRT